MSRQNSNNQKERKAEGTKRDAASHATRSSRAARDNRPDVNRRGSTRRVNYGLDRYGLNDLYERSSI